MFNDRDKIFLTLYNFEKIRPAKKVQDPCASMGDITSNGPNRQNKLIFKSNLP